MARDFGLIIRGPDDLKAGAVELVGIEPRFQRPIEALTGDIPLRLKPPGFATLMAAIVSQQVSVASARAIWGRVEAAGLHLADAVRLASDDDLRGAGLSRPKVRYARALAEAAVDFDALAELEDQAVIEKLVALPGIGIWTAEIYLLFSLGRADVLPAGDLALQLAAADLFGHEARLSEPDLRALAQNWAPWRGVAARLLWSWYHQVKKREGIGL